MIDDVLTKTVITVRERRQEENESKPWRIEKKTGAQKTSSFSLTLKRRTLTENNTLVRVLLSLSRRRRGRSKRRAFLLVSLLKSDRLRRRRRKKTKDDGVDFLRVVVVQFRRHPKKGATT